MFNSNYNILAELRESPWVSKIGNNLSNRENLAMTSTYERASAVRKNSWGGGRATQSKPDGGAVESDFFFRSMELLTKR